MKRLIPLIFVVAVLACLTAGSASALTFQDKTCDNNKPTCIIPNGSAEVPYQFDMYARSGCPPYHYNFTGGTPPPGLTLTSVNDSSGGIGRLAGTPTTPGHYLFYVTITTPESPTCLGDRADRLFEMSVGVAPLAIKTASLRTGIAGQAYTETLAASGGGSQTWSATGLPAGLSVSGATIVGTPTASGDFNVTITVNNGTSSKSAQYVLKIIEPLKVTTSGARVAEVGRPFSTKLAVTGGSGTHSLAVTGVPAGLTFDTVSGALSGSPTSAGVYTVKVTVTDTTSGLTQDVTVPLKVAAHVSVFTRRLKAASVGQRYAVKLRASGGVRPLKWRALGKLPAGLKLDARTGALVGTPRTGGKFVIEVRVTDGLRASSTGTLALTVRG